LWSVTHGRQTKTISSKSYLSLLTFGSFLCWKWSLQSNLNNPIMLTFVLCSCILLLPLMRLVMLWHLFLSMVLNILVSHLQLFYAPKEKTKKKRSCARAFIQMWFHTTMPAVQNYICHLLSHSFFSITSKLSFGTRELSNGILAAYICVVTYIGIDIVSKC
jgi:hypothetical protein